MKIKNNEDFLNYLNKRKELREKFVSETETINYVYFSLNKEIKEKVRNWVYLFGLTVILLIFIILFTVFELIYPVEFGSFLMFINVIIILTVAFFSFKKIKEKNKINKEWEKLIKETLKYKEEAFEYSKKAAKEVIPIICFTENYENINQYRNEYSSHMFSQYWDELIKSYTEKINQEIKKPPTPDDLIDYYNKWGRLITQSEYVNYQYFLEQRRKWFKVE